MEKNDILLLVTKSRHMLRMLEIAIGGNIMLVYICCSGGATSGMLCQKIAEASHKTVTAGYIYDLLRDMEQLLSEYELVLACGPVDVLHESNFKHLGLEGKVDCILISPQVRFMAPMVKGYFDNLHIPLDVIEMRTFGTMNGAKVWENIQAMLG